MLSTMSKILLIGGTGRLGAEIAKGLITAGFDQHVALVRPSAAMEKTEKLQSLGWTINQVDFDQASDLTAALTGANVVVSALGGPTLRQAEMAIVDAAQAAGVSLFVPSQFGIDYRRWNVSHPVHKNKEAVLEHAKSVGLPTLSVFTGVLSDMTFNALTDLSQMKATVVSGGKHKVSFTRRSDIGYVLAKALKDPKYSSGGFLSMQGTTVTWKEALEMLEKAVGKSFEISDLSPEEATQKEKDLLQKGDMPSFLASFGTHLLAEPARGSSGFDVSAEADDLGFAMETLETTIQNTYGSKE